MITEIVLFILVFKARSPAPTSTPGEYIPGALIATYERFEKLETQEEKCKASLEIIILVLTGI